MASMASWSVKPLACMVCSAHLTGLRSPKSLTYTTHSRVPRPSCSLRRARSTNSCSAGPKACASSVMSSVNRSAGVDALTLGGAGDSEAVGPAAGRPDGLAEWSLDELRITTTPSIAATATSATAASVAINVARPPPPRGLMRRRDYLRRHVDVGSWARRVDAAGGPPSAAANSAQDAKRADRSLARARAMTGSR